MEDGGDDEECGQTQQQLHNRRMRLHDRLKLAIIATAEQTAQAVRSETVRYLNLVLLCRSNRELWWVMEWSAAQKQDMEVSAPVMNALVDLTFKFAGLTEHVASDTELFAQHAGRKSVMMDDVLLAGFSVQPILHAARRNGDVVASLRLTAQNITKSKEQRPDKKRKKASAKAVES